MEKTSGRQTAEEAVKYTIIGIGSTVVQYAAYSAVYAMTENYVAANTAGFLLSVLFSYYWNRRIVFHSAKTTVWWRVLIKNYVLYFGTGIVATNLLSYLMIDLWHISPYLSPILIVLILYPFNFLLNKFWAHKGDKAV